MILPDPFALSLAVAPVIVYLVVIGLIRVCGRVMVISGVCEVGALGFAVSGMMAVGPAQLFFPTAAGMLFQWKVWFMLAIFYGLCVALAALAMRPRLVVYGMTAKDLLPLISHAASTLDPSTHVDEQKAEVVLPHRDVRLRVESLPGSDYVSLVALEEHVRPAFWKQLRRALRQQTAPVRGPLGRHGMTMLVVAALMLGGLLLQGLPQPERLVEGFRQWLYRE